MSARSQTQGISSKTKWTLGGVFLLVLAVIGGFTYANGDGAITNSIKELFVTQLQGRSPTERVLITIAFIGFGNAVLIPINIILFVVALIIPPWEAFMAGVVGAVLAALLGYVYGRVLDVGFVKDKMGRKYDLVRKEISHNALKSVILLCFAPIAPNTITNILAGMCKVPIWKLVVGTIIGFVPGVAIITLLSRQMRNMVEDPGYQAFIAIAAILAVLFFSYKMGKRIQRRIENQETP